MRVAFTGSSSTGKTTLAQYMANDKTLLAILPRLITVDARKLLMSRGFHSMDKMSRDELRDFQRLYLKQKIASEAEYDGYLTDRSFVDVCAYWLERDAEGLPVHEVSEFVDTCRREAARYDLHFYFPSGLLPFVSDGYRSEIRGFHERVNIRILELIDKWAIDTVRIDMVDLQARRDAVIGAVAACRIG